MPDSRGSPASRTQRFAKPRSTVWSAREGYLVSRTPERPDFNYGHALLLPETPELRGLGYWLGRWQFEHAPAECDQAFFLWEQMGPGGGAPFGLAELPSGSTLQRNLCLELGAGSKPVAAKSSGFEFRAFDQPADWRAVIELTAQVNDDGGFLALERAAWLYAGYRELVEGGVGEWLGAFEGSRLVGSLGLIRGDGEARFQDVATHAEYRRRGICSSLVTLAVSRYQGRSGAGPVYILAKSGGSAERLYRSLGFAPVSTLFELAVPARS